MPGDAKIERLRVIYYDEARASDVVTVGGWEIVEVQRKYANSDLEGKLEPTYFLAYLGARRKHLVADGVGFEAWGADVAMVEEEGPGESQAPPAT